MRPVCWLNGLTLLMLKHHVVFLIHSKLELLIQFPASIDKVYER